MSKNAYEIRLETLRMAKEMADSKYCLQQDIMYRMIDQAVEKREDIEKVVRKKKTDGRRLLEGPFL